MKNPHINRMIGYIVTFIGFFVVYKGAHDGSAPNGFDGYNSFVLVIGIILIIVAFVWMLLMVRCPHCKGLLDIRLKNIDVCPHCGKNTKI